MRIVGDTRRGGLLAAVAYAALAFSTPASAQSARSVYNEAVGQDLGTALTTVARNSGKEVIFSADAVLGKKAPAIQGSFTADEAVRVLIKDSGLTADYQKDVILIRGRGTAANQASGGSSTSDDIVVTGTHIRGAHIASPVITLSRDQMLNAGETNLGDVVRNIPQAFGGGQNPGVLRTTGAGQGNSNLNSSSTINLRGLGPDATLTLINGHRMPSDGATQAVDISAIPVAALDRLEIVADGASALYGSDAVGGVANVILRRDFKGLETDARLGAATDGGNFQQQYDVVTGSRWSTGGFILTYDFQRSTAVDAGQRSITDNINPTTTLFPYLRQHTAILSGHQSLGSNVEVSLDATFNRRNSAVNFATTLSAPAQYTGQVTSQITTGYSIAPRIQWRAPHDWLVAVSGLYGRDKADFTSLLPSGGIVASSSSQGYYTNTTKSVEVTGEGAIATLPAGSARLALGAGHRDVGLNSHATSLAGAVLQNFDGSRSSNYGYGELFLPLIEPKLAVPGVKRLEATAAIRYESYDGIGSVATPKVGLVYAPISDLTLRGTWGKSYKTPTLYQQYQGYAVALYSAAQVGASNLPSGSTILYTGGGNPNLTPERATSWTAGAEFKPHWVPGLTLEAGYFHIDYRNRIVTPPFALNGVLSNPLYSQFVTTDPSVDLVNTIVAGERSFANIAGVTFNPAKVVALVNQQITNVAHQTVRGVDMAAKYHRDFDHFHAIDLSASATYLESQRTIYAGAAETPAAEVIYYPVKWRARGGGTFTDHAFAMSAFVNYIGPIADNSQQPFQQVRGMTTMDTVLRIQPASDSGFLRGITMTIAASNLFNAKPARIRVASVALYPAYDATNYSAIGRVVSVTLGKRW